jgi:hypothetical protein
LYIPPPLALLEAVLSLKAHWVRVGEEDSLYIPPPEAKVAVFVENEQRVSDGEELLQL